MTTVNKSTISLTMLGLFGLALVCTADAATPLRLRHTDKPIAACVEEIGRHADYRDAFRVLHTVFDLDQLSLVAMKIRIETNVYLNGDDSATREYVASCVTDSLGAVVRFHLAETHEQ